jgi:hypothetical protein
VRRVVEEAESLVRRHLDVVGSIPPEAAAVAVLWAAARAAGEPKPLEDLLKCSKADRWRVRKAAWQLTKAVGLGRRPNIEDYVKTLAARANLPAFTAMSVFTNNLSGAALMRLSLPKERHSAPCLPPPQLPPAHTAHTTSPLWWSVLSGPLQAGQVKTWRKTHL